MSTSLEFARYPKNISIKIETSRFLYIEKSKKITVKKNNKKRYIILFKVQNKFVNIKGAKIK